MGLESLTPTTFIAGLTQSWPTASEQKSQGDDHIRLLKGVLQNTFPNATKAMYLPKSVAAAGTLALDVSAQNSIITVATPTGDVGVTLPIGLTTNDSGWSCEIVKTTSDGNAAVVSPGSGTINSQVGATATIRVGALYVPARFIWTGSLWICVKPGPMVGTTYNFDGPALPSGSLVLDGTAFNATTYAELALALGGTTLRDKRGRVEAGVDGGAGRLTNGSQGSGTFYGFGTAPVLGAASGLEYHAITYNEMPSHRHSASFYDPGHTHTYGPPNSTASQTPGGAFPATTGAAPAIATGGAAWGGIGRAAVWDGSSFDVTYLAGGGWLMSIIQPTIITQKLIRAC